VNFFQVLQKNGQIFNVPKVGGGVSCF